MRPGERERNIWWHIVDQCRERGRVEPMAVYGLTHGGGWRMLLVGAALVTAGVVGLAVLLGG